jgi:predicted MPP superfamily phosphohydrolase
MIRLRTISNSAIQLTPSLVPIPQSQIIFVSEKPKTTDGIEQQLECSIKQSTFKEKNKLEPLEQISRLISLVGASDFRELVKKVVFRKDSEVRVNIESSKNRANAFYASPKSFLEGLARNVRIQGIENSYKRHSIDKNTWLHNYSVALPRLPAEVSGLKILHLSDIHFKAGRSDRVQSIVNMNRFLREKQVIPDLVLISGDIITSYSEDLDAFALKALEQVPFKIAKAYVKGNHDFYNRAVSCLERKMMEVGYSDLTNSHFRIGLNKVFINIFGVDDHLEGRPAAPIITQAHESEVNIIVTHNLDAIQAHFPKAVDLILSGHTHAGEVNVAGITGGHMMKLFGYLDVLNGHIKGWRSLSKRTLSYISPGHAVHYYRYRTQQAGATMIEIKSPIFKES